MPALVAGIHAFLAAKTWMAGQASLRSLPRVGCEPGHDGKGFANCAGLIRTRKIDLKITGRYAMGRLHAVAIALCLVLPALPRPAAAEDWPARPITIVVPFAAGGTTDIVARILSQPLSLRLGQSVIIENLGGAGGTLGANQAAKAT